jgi:hypothetical protein
MFSYNITFLEKTLQAFTAVIDLLIEVPMSLSE